MTPDLPSHLEFERATGGSPTDVQRFLVYADALSEQGDPLGALIAQQTSPAATPLTQLEASTLVIKHHLGLSSRESQAMGLEWRWGFVDSLSWRAQKDEAVNVRVLARVLSAPACRFVRSLKIDTAHDASWLAQVLPGRELPLLRRLSCAYGVRQFRSIREALPQLEQLSLGVTNLNARALDFPALRSLELTGFGPELDALFARPPWVTLTNLTVEQGVSDLRAVLARCPLTSLNVSGSDALNSIAASPHLPRLRRLTVRNFQSLQGLLERRAELSGLSLHLSHGFAPESVLTLLRSSLASVTTASVWSSLGRDD